MCVCLQIEIVQKPLEGAAGSTFYFQVNGIPIFAKGDQEKPVGCALQLLRIACLKTWFQCAGQLADWPRAFSPHHCQIYQTMTKHPASLFSHCQVYAVALLHYFPRVPTSTCRGIALARALAAMHVMQGLRPCRGSAEPPGIWGSLSSLLLQGPM